MDSEHLQKGRGCVPGLQDKPLECWAALQVLGEPIPCVRQAWQFLKFFEMFWYFLIPFANNHFVVACWGFHFPSPHHNPPPRSAPESCHSHLHGHDALPWLRSDPCFWVVWCHTWPRSVTVLGRQLSKRAVVCDEDAPTPWDVEHFFQSSYRSRVCRVEKIPEGRSICHLSSMGHFSTQGLAGSRVTLVCPPFLL